MPRRTSSLAGYSTWRSAASARCSSPIRWPRSRTSPSPATQRAIGAAVWQRSEDNEWAQAIDGALGDAAQPPSPGADPFSLGDAEATARLLERAGFDGLRFEDVREPVFYGRDIDDALETIRGFESTRAALATLTGDETSPRTTAPNTAWSSNRAPG